MKTLNIFGRLTLIATIIFLFVTTFGCTKEEEDFPVYETTTTTTTTTIDLRDKNRITLLTEDELVLINNEIDKLSKKNKKTIKNRAGQSNWDRSNINANANDYGESDIIDLSNEKTAEISDNIKIKTSVLFNYGSFNKYVKISNPLSDEYTTKKEEYVIQESLEVVKEINEILKQIPEYLRIYAKFMVVGYTDSSYIGYKPDTSKASWDFNKGLSQKRANTIKQILVNQFHVNEANIEDYGMSFSNQIINAEGRIDQVASRRTEILISY